MKVLILIAGLLILSSQNSFSQETLFTDEWHEKLDSDLEFISFPNPNKGIFSVRIYRGSSESHSIIVRNKIGQIVFEGFCARECEVDLSRLDDGMYFIEVSNEKKKSYSTIVIK